MKKHFYLLAMLVWSCGLLAETHITISNPETWTVKELAPYSGQTVIFDSPMYVTSNARGTYYISPRRLYTPTNQAAPLSAAYNNIVALNSSGYMTISGISGYHRCGEKIYNLKVKVNNSTSVSWISGEWRGNTRNDILNTNVRSLVNIDGCDSCLLVCTINLEYYIVEKPSSTGPGPKSKSAHEDQRAKVRKALAKINADLFGFVEIEQGQAALEELKNDLNSSLSGRNYKYINDGTSSQGTYTKAGFIYDANRLEPGPGLQSFKSGTIGEERHRMIWFRDLVTGERFIFAVNHFKAKSGTPTEEADKDHGDGQKQYNAMRVGEAKAAVSKYKEYSKAISEKDLLLMGDLNAYAKEDPIQVLTSSGLIDLHRAYHADTSYSYQFGGLAGYLDHAICSGTMYHQVRGAVGFHINSDEDDRYTFDGSWDDGSMFRCSDHDPVLVGLKLDSVHIDYNPQPDVNTQDLMSGEASHIVISNAFDESGSARSFYAIYTITGLLIEQNEITSEYQQIEMPHNSGVYIVYIYAEGKVFQKKVIIR